MLHVVDVLPGKAELEALGLAEKDFHIHPELYRDYVAQFHRDFAEFSRTYHKGERTDGEAAATRPAGDPAGADEACLAAFERSLPPFYYRRGGIYRYRIDRNGNAERAIILESFDRDEIMGTLGINGFLHEHSLFRLLVRRLEKWLIRHDKS
jgi:hypothetical protein